METLVKTLNATVNNPNLYFVGELRVIVHTIDNETGICFIEVDSNSVNIKSSRPIIINNNHVQVTEFTGKPRRIDIPYDEDDCIISITNKYSLTDFSVYNISCLVDVDLEHLGWDKIKTVIGSTIKGYLYQLSPTMTTLETKDSPELLGDIKDLRSEIFSILDLQGCPNITGNVADIKGTALTTLKLGSITTGVYGDIADLADKMYNAGRVSGTLVVYPGNGVITLNSTIIKVSGGKTITFSADGWTHD